MRILEALGMRTDTPAVHVTYLRKFDTALLVHLPFGLQVNLWQT